MFKNIRRAVGFVTFIVVIIGALKSVFAWLADSEHGTHELFADEEDVFLFWNGRKEDVTNIALPFHSIEHIDEPRKESQQEGK